jgi:hypothetical protein
MRIGGTALEAMLAKLRNLTTGFNARMDEKAGDYRLLPWHLEFPETIYGYSTRNFFLGQMNPELVAEQGPVGHNRAWLYVSGTDNLNIEKPADFSGLLRVALDFNLEWTCSAQRQNFETPSLLLEDVVTDITQGIDQSWGSHLIYNGAYTCQRTALDVESATSTLSVRQMVFFRFTFQLSDRL